MQVKDRRVGIIGVGGGGCRLAGLLAAAAQGGPTVMALDTDSRDLTEVPVPVKVLMGEARTRGQGAGGDELVGRQSAEDDFDKIRNLISGLDLLFIVAGLGGGTGTGAAPVILRAAREEDVTALCFGVLPFTFEGENRRRQADHGIVELREAADALIVLSNDRLFEAAGAPDVNEAFARAGGILTSAMVGVWDLVTRPGFISVSFADLRRLVRHGGVCSMGYGGAEGEGRAARALEALLTGPMLEKGRILSESRSLLVSIIGGSDLAVQEIGEIMNGIKGVVREDATVTMGTAIDPGFQGRIGITVIATEQLKANVDVPAEPVAHMAPPKGTTPPVGREPRAVQTDLHLETYSRGMFKNLEPTLLNNQDLDYPTFMRRGMVLEK